MKVNLAEEYNWASITTGANLEVRKNELGKSNKNGIFHQAFTKY
jgi:hypothetical protein